MPSCSYFFLLAVVLEFGLSFFSSPAIFLLFTKSIQLRLSSLSREAPNEKEIDIAVLIPSTSRELQCHFPITSHTQQDCPSLTDKDQSSSHLFETSKRRRYLRASSQANNCQNCCCCSFVHSSSCYLQFDEREKELPCTTHEEV